MVYIYFEIKGEELFMVEADFVPRVGDIINDPNDSRFSVLSVEFRYSEWVSQKASGFHCSHIVIQCQKL